MSEVTAAHRLARMVGRDPAETHRTATPLELLFDLTFVVAFGFAGNAVAHAFAEGHWTSGLAGFGLSLFAIIWAWINFTWFASAFDTDDWVFRVVTFVQMVGVMIAALGIPPVFASLEAHEHLDNRVLVAGYVVMRVAMIFQWLRAAGTRGGGGPPGPTPPRSGSRRSAGSRCWSRRWVRWPRCSAPWC